MADPVTEYALTAVDRDLFAVRAPETQTWTPVLFYELPGGETYVHFGVRATPKMESTGAGQASAPSASVISSAAAASR
jgi:hypothetical protein